MAETISPYALTTLQRIKDRIFDPAGGAAQPTAHDTVLTRMINSCSEWFERECYDRHFVQRTYVNEIYSATSPRMKRMITRQAPVIFRTVTGTTTLGSTTVTAISSTTGMVVGMPINGTGIASGATIAAIGSTTITLSAAATAAGTATYLQANGILSFQYRAGPPSNPSWTSFIPDQFELVNDGKAGVLRIYGALPDMYSNMARITYTAGYPVDWSNAGNNTTHLLPADITDTVENLVVRRFKRRMLSGKASEGVDGATTSWRDDIDLEDRDVIDHYRRMPAIF